MTESRDNSTPPASLLDAALWYFQRYGWSLIPINAKTKKPYRGFGWKQFQKERPAEADLMRWFSGGKYTGLAAICGAVSDNLCVLDLDTAEACQWWDANHSGKSLPTARTRQGRHLFMRYTSFPKQNGDGVDLLSDGSYVVLAPSPGKMWLTPPNGEIPEIDPFLLGLHHFGIEKPTDTPHTPMASISSISSVSSVSSLSSVNWRDLSGDLRRAVESAIASSLPQEPGRRNKAIFRLCQSLKGIPELRDRPAGHLREIVQEWHKLALPAITTKPFDETWAEFVHGWRRVKWPKGTTLGMALARALEDTGTPPEAAGYQDDRNQLLVRVCWQLQQVHGDAPFFLSYYVAGRILDLSHTEAGKRLEMLIEDGIIASVEPHTNIKATRYRYIGARKEER